MPRLDKDDDPREELTRANQALYFFACDGETRIASVFRRFLLPELSFGSLLRYLIAPSAGDVDGCFHAIQEGADVNFKSGRVSGGIGSGNWLAVHLCVPVVPILQYLSTAHSSYAALKDSTGGSGAPGPPGAPAVRRCRRPDRSQGDVNLSLTTRPPLARLSQEVASLLLENGADPDCRDAALDTALHAAVHAPHAELVFLVAEASLQTGGDSLNAQGLVRGALSAPPLCARQRTPGSSPAVRFTLTCVCNPPPARRQHGETPMHRAARADAAAAVSALLELGASVDILDDVRPDPPTHTRSPRDLLSPRLWLPPLCRSQFGRSPLHFAARDGALDCIVLLRAAGAEPAGDQVRPAPPRLGSPLAVGTRPQR